MESDGELWCTNTEKTIRKKMQLTRNRRMLTRFATAMTLPVTKTTQGGQKHYRELPQFRKGRECMQHSRIIHTP